MTTAQTKPTTLVFPMSLSGLRTYKDSAAALAAGETLGTLYATPTGALARVIPAAPKSPTI